MAFSLSRYRRPIAIILALSLAACVVLIVRQGFFIEPDSLIVREYTVDLPSWPASLDGFRIAAVGDVHAGSPHVDQQKLETLVQRISSAKVDLIVWLGDYVIQEVVGGTFMEPEQVAAILSRAQARYGHAAVIGNHDRWLGVERVERSFAASGIPFLRWGSKTLSVNGLNVHIHGLDDFELSPNYYPSLEAARREWRALPKSEPLIVLSHSPDVFPFLPPRVTLTLAAHTHGGQVRLPLIGSPIVPSAFGQRFVRGLVVENGKYLFVNTGIGTSIIPIRLGVPPEISILVLRAQATH